MSGPLKLKDTGEPDYEWDGEGFWFENDGASVWIRLSPEEDALIVQTYHAGTDEPIDSQTVRLS